MKFTKASMKEFHFKASYVGSLYRYQPYCDKYIDYFKQLILENKIFYSNPMSFNDPFDCKLYGIEFSEESVYRAMKLRIWHNVSDKFARAYFNKHKDSIMKKCNTAIPNMYNMIDKDVGILCLTTDFSNILMYSHYADKHKGICLEFDYSKDKELTAQPVIYRDDYPEITFSDSDEAIFEFVAALASTKAKLWEYEKEYRCMRSDGAGLVTIPNDHLTGIIFGCESTANTIDSIVKYVDEAGKNIKFQKAVRNTPSFTLSIVPL